MLWAKPLTRQIPEVEAVYMVFRLKPQCCTKQLKYYPMHSISAIILPTVSEMRRNLTPAQGSTATALTIRTGIGWLITLTTSFYARTHLSLCKILSRFNLHSNGGGDHDP